MNVMEEGLRIRLAEVTIILVTLIVGVVFLKMEAK